MQNEVVAGSFWIVYLVFVFLIVHVVRRALRNAPMTSGPGAYWWVAIDLVVFSVAFFLPFFLVGVSEILIDRPALGPVTLVATAGALLLIFGAFSWSRPTAENAPVPPEARDEIMSWSKGVGVLALVAMLALFTVVAAMLIVGYPSGFEGNAYHLPIAVNLFKTGSFGVWDHAYMHTFPANMSVYTGLLLQLVPEHLVSAANIPFLVIACFSVYGLARAAGGAPGDCLIAAAGLASVPLVAFSGFEIGADVAGIAFLGLAYLIFLASPDQRFNWILLAGCAAGLAYGFKSLHLVGAGVLGLFVMWRSCGEVKGFLPSFWSAVRAGAVYGFAFLALSGFWLLRNYSELGNPLYPVHLGILFDAFGWASAPDVDYTSRSETQYEWVSKDWQWLIYPWVEGHYIGQNFKHSSGFGAFVATMMPVALAVGFVTTVRRVFATGGVEAVDRSACAAVATLTVASALIAIVWWLLVDRQPRYLMGLLVLGLPLFAPLVRIMSVPGARVMRGLGVVTVLMMFSIAGSMQLFDFVSRYVISGQFSRAEFYGYPAMVDDLPAGAAIINLSSRTNNYRLYGKQLANRVVPPTSIRLALKDGSDVSVTPEMICEVGATHIYSEENSSYKVMPDIKLARLDELTTNPSNNQPMGNARILWEILDVDDLCR